MEEPQRIDHFELREQITQSEDVAVWRAIDDWTGVDVAIKVLMPGQPKDSFLREASLWQKIDHPNLASVYAIGEYEGLPWVAMEYSAHTLANLLADPVPLDQELVSSIALAIARGLQAANEAGLVIADVTPPNVLLTEGGTPKVTAYGPVRLTSDSEATGKIPSLKTQSYASPEQVQLRGFDQRSVIYTFGVLLFQMLTSATPFSGSEEEIAVQQRRRPATPIVEVRQDVWPEMGRIADRCLERDPDLRFQTFFELVINLALASGGTPPEQHKTMRQRLWDLKLPVAAALAVVVAGVAATFFVVNALPTTIEATAPLSEATDTQLSITNEDGTRISVFVPPDAYPAPAMLIIRAAPVGGAESVEQIDDSFSVADKFELVLTDMDGKVITQPTFKQPVVITVDYTDRHVELVENIPRLLTFARLNEPEDGDAEWELLLTAVNTEAKTLEMLVGHFTVFGVAAVSDAERLPQPPTPTPTAVVPTATPIPTATPDGTPVTPAATVAEPTPTAASSQATVTPLATPTPSSTATPTPISTPTATQPVGPLDVSFASGRWVGNGWGRHLIVTAGRSVIVYVTLDSTHTTDGNLLVEVRKDNAITLDSTVAVCAGTLGLERGVQEIAACSFTPTDVTGGTVRHYYFRVYWENNPIYLGEEPDARATLRVVEPSAEPTLGPVPPLPASDKSPVPLLPAG